MSKVHDIVTEQVIELLEQVDPNSWERPWATASPRPINGHSKKPYRGSNVFMLWMAAHVHGYSSNTWLTFNQAKEMGGHVRKGESHTKIVNVGKAKRKDVDEDAPEEEKYYRYFRYYQVWNLDQIEGVDAAVDFDPLPESERLPSVDTFIANTGAEIQEGCAGACYLPSQDKIQLPAWERFDDATGAYTTAFHELAHWTGHPSRLDRESLGERFGSHAYAAEELIAELAAAYVAADLRLPLEYERPATYLANWLECLKKDSQAIFAASSAAQKAADFLHALQTEAEEDSVDNAAA
jgi:antirestriction protein ArdC